ncbi:hypothetical protein KUTeg_023682 [Tegillarca granosa]|uniref:non-specific serine/threonine protein kinase n=1 Tax=Tegillarca granosa TaxID=220873 RepID=A0ABQ9E7U3_TEGGR|nr:hypothetical protein KUTeg_023682 [Tegillarca granosa]
MIKKARFQRDPQVHYVETGNKSPRKTMPESPKPNSGKKQSPSPIRRGGSGKSASPKKSPSPVRYKKGESPNRRSKSPPKSGKGRESKSPSTPKSGRERGRSGSTKKKKEVRVKSPDTTEDGLKIVKKRREGLTIIPVTLLGEKDIGELYLSGNNLTSLPPTIMRWTSLRKLDLSKNGIQCKGPNDFYGLPQEMGTLNNLEDLNISECNLMYIPPVIWQLTHLKFLDVSRNKFNILLPEIGNLTSLQKLNLKHTNICSLPPEIAYCQELEEILLWGNTIESLPETLTEMLKLKTLALNYQSFCGVIDEHTETMYRKGQIITQHIPGVVFELPCMETLDLENTKINNLPDTYNLNLKDLILRKNFLDSLPSSVYNLNHLTLIDLSYNLVKKLPEEIGRVVSLEKLRLDNNQLTTLPDNIGLLHNLEELDLASNQIQSLPQTINGLKSLKYLILEKNQLTELPDEICELLELETLDITENKIHTLPMKLHQLVKLRDSHGYRNLRRHGLWLYKNPLVQPPPNVWRTDKPEKIFDYLKKLAIVKTENLQRQKILVLGETQCGKTSFVRGLVHHKSILTKAKTDKTAFVEQTLWRTENAVELIINDFGGDPSYTIGYPLFLDNKAMVLVVYDHSTYSTETHESAIGQWIELLNQYTPGAVIKLVGTKTDLCEEETIDETTQLVKDLTEKQLENYKNKLLKEQKSLETETAHVRSQVSSDGNQDYLQHLELQKENLENLIKHPLKMLPDIATISSIDGLPGVSDLINSIELMAIDTTLFPHAQRCIPSHWNNLRAELKRQEGYYLKLEEVKEIAKKFDIHDQELEDCIHYLHDVGEVLWFHNLIGLALILFHKPRLLVELITALYRHDFNSFLNFEKNKVFMSKGNLSPKDFSEAVEIFQKNGQISRPMLNCFWFYQNLSYDKLNELLDLMPMFDVCYTVPEPEIPKGRIHTKPLMVLPWYNQEYSGTDLTEIWEDNKDKSEYTVSLSYNFPLGLPSGVFERISATMQDIILERIDWKDAVYATTDFEKLLIKRSHDNELDLDTLTLTVKADDLSNIECLIKEATLIISKVLVQTNGLIWRIRADKNLWENNSICFHP